VRPPVRMGLGGVAQIGDGRVGLHRSSYIVIETARELSYRSSRTTVKYKCAFHRNIVLCAHTRTRTRTHAISYVLINTLCPPVPGYERYRAADAGRDGTDKRGRYTSDNETSAMPLSYCQVTHQVAMRCIHAHCPGRRSSPRLCWQRSAAKRKGPGLNALTPTAPL